MKKKLFFYSKLQKILKKEISSFFSVFMLLMCLLPLSFSANVPQQSEQESDQIYIAGNAKIFGANNTSGITEVETIAVEIFSKKSIVKAKQKSSNNSISAQVKQKKAKEVEKAKELERVAKENINVSFINTNSTSNFFGSSTLISIGAVLSFNFYSLYKFSKSISEDVSLSSTIKSKNKKQKFYTSLSYLQFGKYRNSSLRAPPVFS